MPEHPLVQRVYDGLGPWARADESGDLLTYVRALVEPLAIVEDVVRDTDTHAGWGTLLDLDAAPSWALPWLSQFVGVSIIAGLSDTAQRNRIRAAAGFRRGTPAAIIAAAQQHLTGDKIVELYEREGGPWSFRLRTYASETPDPAKVLAAVKAVKPAGLVLVYELQEGIEIDDLVGDLGGLAGSVDSYGSTTPVSGGGGTPEETGLGFGSLGESPLGD